MASVSISSEERLVQQVLRYVPVRDLFTCSQVNALWKRLSLALLKKKLSWVLCSAPRKDDDEAWCLRSYCSQMRHFCRIARLAGKKATLHFLLISKLRDNERSVLKGARRSLPQDCVTLLFKSKRDRTLNLEGSYEGLNGVLVFDTIDKKTRSRRRNRCSSKVSPTSDRSCRSDVGSLNRVSKFLRRLVLGDRGNELPSCFKNTSPYALTFQSTINVPLEDAGHITYFYTEETTGHKLQVTTASLHAGMKYRSVDCLFSLRDSFRDTSSAIILVFQTEPVDMFVMEHIYCVFSDVAVVSLTGEVVGEMPPIASGGYTMPASRGEITVMLLKLLPAYSEKKSKKKKTSKISTRASV